MSKYRKSQYFGVLYTSNCTIVKKFSQASEVTGYLAKTVVVSSISNVSDVITEHKILKHIYLSIASVYKI